MPAPAAPPRRPTARKAISTASGRLTNPTSVINPDSASNENELVQLQVSGEIPLSERLAQFWLFGVAMLGLWGGLFYIAFTQGETNERFLLLGIGGLVTAAAFIWVVELQRRKHGELALMHDYILGMGLFFAAAGVFWGLRYLMAIAADPAGPLNWSWLVDEARPYAEKGWYPGAAGVAVHGIAALALGLASWWYLKIKETGTGMLSWFVAALTPFALMMVGLGTWIEWSNGGVSYELGVTIVGLSILGMWIGIQSNRALVFSVVVVLASFMPIIYELVNDGSGSALSLMVFIIFAQGLLAITPQLAKAQHLVERASLGLVLAALIAMAWMTGGNLSLHLGPVKFRPDYWLSGAAILWMSLLIGYMKAVHMKRTPWMPVGLAFALFLIPYPSNQLTWFVTLGMIPYLLWKPDSRAWVRHATFICAAFAFLVADWMSHAESIGEGKFWGTIEGPLIQIIPLALLGIGEWARRINRISGNAFRSGMILVVLSPSMLINANSLIPWAFAAYLLAVAYESMSKKADDLAQRKEASLTILTSLVLTTLLAATGRLEITWSQMPDFQGFNLVLMIIAATYYVVGMKSKVEELDLGHFSAMAVVSGANQTVFDPKTGIYTVQKEREEEDPESPAWLDKGWGSVARISIVGPLLLFAIALASVDADGLVDGYWVLALAIPAAILIYELLKMEEIKAESRAMAVWTMLLISLPISIQLNLSIINGVGTTLKVSQLLFDFILLLGPVVIHQMMKKGIFGEELHSKNADLATLIGLLGLGLLDTTGGLAFFPLFIIVAYRTVVHRLNVMAYLTSISLFMMSTRPAMESGILMNLFKDTSLEESLLSTGWMWIFPVSRIIGWLGAGFALLMLGRIIQDRRDPPEDDERLPFIWSAILLLVSLQSIMIHDEYLLLVLTTVVLVLGWMAGRVEVFSIAPWVYIFAFMPALDATFELSEGELFSWSFLLSGIITMWLSFLAREGILFKYADKIKPPDDGTTSIIKAETLKGREDLQRYLYWTGLLFLFLSFDIFYGISTIIAALWVTYDSLRRGEKSIFLSTPILHAFALANAERFFTDLPIEYLGGWTMLIGGLLFSYLSWSKWYPKWEWSEDGAEYWQFNDRLGIFGVIYFAIGIWWAMFAVSGLLIAVIIIAYGGAMVAVDPEATWRRVMGIVSSTLGGFIALVDGQDQTLSGIVMIMAGLAAFIQAAMYFQRWGVGFSEIVETEETEEEKEITIKAVIPIPKPILSADDYDGEAKEAELIDDLKMLIAKQTPEPVAEASNQEASVLDMSNMSDACTARVIDIVNGVVDTGKGVKIKLNETMAEKIRQALLNTEFGGYIPMVGFDQLGRAVLSFEKDLSLS